MCKLLSISMAQSAEARLLTVCSEKTDIGRERVADVDCSADRDPERAPSFNECQIGIQVTMFLESGTICV